MFNAPQIYLDIPDIAQIYDINAKQEQALDETVAGLDADIFLDTMGETKIARWEKLLGISPQDDDRLDDRRLRVKSKVLEKLPYTYRVIIRRMDALCPDGYTLELSNNRNAVTVKLALKSKKMITQVGDMLEQMLPLSVLYDVTILYNTYALLAYKSYGALSAYTYQGLRDEIIE